MRLLPAHAPRPLPAHPATPPAGGRRRGAAVVEFAVVAPLLFLLILASIEFGRAFMSLEVLNNAARAGARQGVLSGSSNSDVTTAVQTQLTNSGIPTANATITVLVNGTQADASTAVRGDTLTVTVTVPYSAISWLPSPLFLGSQSISGKTVMRHE